MTVARPFVHCDDEFPANRQIRISSAHVQLLILRLLNDGSKVGRKPDGAGCTCDFRNELSLQSFWLH